VPANCAHKPTTRDEYPMQPCAAAHTAAHLFDRRLNDRNGAKAVVGSAHFVQFKSGTTTLLDRVPSFLRNSLASGNAVILAKDLC